jgi:hypothetical protein
MIAARLAENRTFPTINPEFGPPPYQPVQPADEAPLADICLWMTERFRTRAADQFAGADI